MMIFSDFATWLSETELSREIGSALWVVPFVQSLHILAIAAIMASAWLLSFRLIGFSGRTQTIAAAYARLAPWIWRALIVLLATGVILIIGEPARELNNYVFFIKMGLLAAAIALTATLQWVLRHNAAGWDLLQDPPAAAKALAVLQLTLWVAIAVAGRWIAYV